MKAFVVLLSVLFVATLASAQAPSVTERPPALEIVKYSWSKERINWEKDPFSSTLEGFDDMRGRITQTCAAASRQKGVHPPCCKSGLPAPNEQPKPAHQPSALFL